MADEWTERFDGALNGDGVEIVKMPSANGVQYVGIRVVGPRGGSRGTAWFDDKGKVDEIIGTIQVAQAALPLFTPASGRDRT